MQAQAQTYPFAQDPQQFTIPVTLTDNGAVEPNASRHVLQAYIAKLQNYDRVPAGTAESE